MVVAYTFILWSLSNSMYTFINELYFAKFWVKRIDFFSTCMTLNHLKPFKRQNKQCERTEIIFCFSIFTCWDNEKCIIQFILVIKHIFFSFIFSSVQLLCCVRLCHPMNCSTPNLSVHHQLRSSLKLTSNQILSTQKLYLNFIAV